MKYTKATRNDCICNICKQESDLSWDHVPPKGGIDLSSMEVRSYNNNFKIDSKERDILQNGLRFRTICRNCNNSMGHFYDSTFNSMMKDAFILAKSQLLLPNSIHINTYPTKIIKALLGHLLASKTNYCDTILDKATREYLFDEKAILPNNIHIYYWFYPFNCTIINHDVYSINPSTGENYSYSIIKSFPLAFAISFNCNLASLLNNFTEITKYNTNNENDIASIPFYTINNCNWDYPESLKYSGIQLVSDNSNDIFATPKKK